MKKILSLFALQAFLVTGSFVYGQDVNVFKASCDDLVPKQKAQRACGLSFICPNIASYCGSFECKINDFRGQVTGWSASNIRTFTFTLDDIENTRRQCLNAGWAQTGGNQRAAPIIPTTKGRN